IKAPAVEPVKSEIVLAEPILVIREEKIKSESDNNIAEEVRAASKPKKPAKTIATKKTVPTPTEKIKVSTAKSGTPQKTVAYDQVFSLVQTGQRALKKNNTIIIRSEE
ncbi:MAG: hypothetical protein IJU31_01725, partial [Synergistaceae bacterium]|nr:hypothetical protein [Synergistaceae bacterium]